MRKKSASLQPRPEKKGLHPRNRHTGRYDFEQLTRCSPALGTFVHLNPFGDPSVDFADPAAVRALNCALLIQFYGLKEWNLPEGYLCPPIPGRADHVHALADLLGSSNTNVIPRGKAVRVLDVGVGASCIYPIIGNHEYGWSFAGTEVDSVALASAQGIIDANPSLRSHVELREQDSPPEILHGVLRQDEAYDLTICNPPFHRSLEEAREGSLRKWRGLGPGAKGEGAAKRSLDTEPVLNFGGQGTELWCPGGEEAFVTRMIEESEAYPATFFWLTSLVSKEASLPAIYEALGRVDASSVRTLDIAHGQKKSRIVAWTFLSPREQEEWRSERWR